MALDLETTGLSPRLDRMIEVGAVRFRGDEVLATFQSLVRPEVAIPRAVQELTGIRDADVAAAPPPQQVLAQLIDFVGDSGVVAHSGNFDLSFLVDGARHGAPEEGQNVLKCQLLVENYCICTVIHDCTIHAFFRISRRRSATSSKVAT